MLKIIITNALKVTHQVKKEAAMNKITITITQDDIDKAGIYGDINNCLIATCLKRCGFKDVNVGTNKVYVWRWLIFRKTYKIAEEDNRAILHAYYNKNLQPLLGKEIILT